MRLEGKVALVTGAGSGIGRLTAETFAREGARVVVADVVDDAGRATVEGIRAAGGEAEYVHCDVSVAEEVEAMVAFAVGRFGKLDVMMNNAGIFHARDGSVIDTDEETWDRTIAINLKGVFLGSKYAVRAMLEGDGGSLINVASFVALMGAAVPQIAYTASKGGVLSMTREIAVEFARRGIRANALCPGPIETPLLAELLADPAARQRRLVHIPVGRFGQGQEIANAALFLASDESSFMTGAALVVDGGITAAYITPE
ncbi:MAG TPA: glucose 1-dehydrogenase [Actinomycetota bacterium]|nr:glucose 1-dehydrogenase [Actinomycetota bacterium]